MLSGIQYKIDIDKCCFISNFLLSSFCTYIMRNIIYRFPAFRNQRQDCSSLYDQCVMNIIHHARTIFEKIEI